MENYIYSGDMNLEHGGIFIARPDGQAQDYLEVVKVTPLDASIGYEGAYFIESGAIYAPLPSTQEGLDKLCSALPVIGARAILPFNPGEDVHWPSIDDNGEILEPQNDDYLRCIAGALDAYHGLDNPQQETIGTATAEESFDGWKLDGRLPQDMTLAQYMTENYCVSIKV